MKCILKNLSFFGLIFTYSHNVIADVITDIEIAAATSLSAIVALYEDPDTAAEVEAELLDRGLVDTQASSTTSSREYIPSQDLGPVENALAFYILSHLEYFPDEASVGQLKSEIESLVIEINTLTEQLFSEYSVYQDNLPDAFRHAYATARLSKKLDWVDEHNLWGVFIMMAYEGQYTGNSPAATGMDQHNNEIGWNIFYQLKNQSNDSIELALFNRSRCYTHVELGQDEALLTDADLVRTVEEWNNDVEKSQAYMNQSNGLTYFVKSDAEREINGCDLPIAKIDIGLYFLEREEVSILSAYSSEYCCTDLLNVSYEWTFDRPIKICYILVGCINKSTFTTRSPKFVHKNYLISDISLLDENPLKVSLTINDGFGGVSEDTFSWINNWGVMVPIVGLLLN